MFKRGSLCGVACIFMLVFSANLVLAATFTTSNFKVTTSDPRLAEQFAYRAEKIRVDCAMFWLGRTLPNWAKPCKISVKVGNNLLPGGSTSFSFNNGEVFGWDMKIQGSVARISDSVLPHEITHMILASHFRAPLPRWADEGAATFMEHKEERDKYRSQLYNSLRHNKGIPLDKLFIMEDYPEDPMPLYAHGFSVAEFLIRQRGPHHFITFVEATLLREVSWDNLVYDYYGYESLQNMQNDWVDWVSRETPDFVGSNMKDEAVQGARESPIDIRQVGAFKETLEVVPDSKVSPSQQLLNWHTTHTTSKN